MKTICNKIHLVLILLLIVWVSPVHSATIDEYVGSWSGNMIIDAVGGSESGHLLIKISSNNGSLTGTVTDDFTGIPQPFQANVSNGNMIFQFPNMDPGNPDCSNWNLPAVATLDDSGELMHLAATGTVCGPGGGQAATVTGDLNKHKPSLQPILSILLKNKVSSWFFSGSDLFQDNMWFGSVKLDGDGKLLNGILDTTSGESFSLSNGQFDTDSSGVVSASFTTSNSTVEELSMQVNTSKNLMAGTGKTVGENKNGLFVFVKKDSGAQYTDLSDQWFLAYSDLVANRTCGGSISFTGLSGLESFRILNGTMECTDGTSHAISGSTLNAFHVNHPIYTTGPGNVVGSFVEYTDTQQIVTNLQLELNVHEKIMAGYGKGSSDSENGLYIFIKKTTNASVADLAGDWYVSLSDLWGNKTFQGMFHFNSSGEFVTGSVSSSDGETMTFTDGSFSVDASGEVTGSLTDTASSENYFVMQLSDNKDMMIGPGAATNSHDNGLLLMIKK